MDFQQAKTSMTLPAELLAQLLISTQVWEDVPMDFITELPSSNGFTENMVVVDRLTKFVHVFLLKLTMTVDRRLRFLCTMLSNSMVCPSQLSQTGIKFLPSLVGDIYSNSMVPSLL